MPVIRSNMEMHEIARHGLGSAASKYDRAINAAAGRLGDIENELLATYSGDEQQLKELAKKYSVPNTANGKLNLEGLQMIVKSAYEKSQRAMNLLSQLLESRHAMMMKLINQIRGN